MVRQPPGVTGRAQACVQPPGELGRRGAGGAGESGPAREAVQAGPAPLGGAEAAQRPLPGQPAAQAGRSERSQDGRQRDPDEGGAALRSVLLGRLGFIGIRELPEVVQDGGEAAQAGVGIGG